MRDFQPYNPARTEREVAMVKTAIQTHKGQESFGERLIRLRKAAGHTQLSLAQEIGVTRRVITYYEGESDFPPAHLLPALAQALGVSGDALLGIEEPKREGKARDTRIERRLRQVEKLPPAQRKQIVQVLDTLIRAAKP